MATYAGRPVFPAFFVDTAGNPQESVAVTVYNRGTLVKPTLYTDRTKAVELANPFTTDAYGNAFPYLDPGDYDALVNGATIPFSVVGDPAEPVDPAVVLAAIPADTFVDFPAGIADGEVPTWDEATDSWIPGTGGSGGATETVNHGADANVARPAALGPVMWVGSVEPVNMLDGDLWLDTDAVMAELVPPSILASPISTVAASGDAAWFTANAALFHRVDLLVPGTYRYFLHRIGTSSGNIQVGVVRLSGAQLLDYTRVAHSGIIASPGTGARRTDLGAFDLEAGPHALFFWADNTTITTPTATTTSAGALRCSTYPTLVGGVPASGTLPDWAGIRSMSGMSLEANV